MLNEKKSDEVIKEIENNSWAVDKLEQKPVTQRPYPPFITSTLQQDGIRQFRMSAQSVMRIAQTLYENGYITYMRTDSVHLSNEAISASRKEIKKLYGNDYLPEKGIQYTGKVKNAQEAHEAIRPAGATFKHPDELKTKLDANQLKLYTLIWKRTLASQMNPAKIQEQEKTLVKN